MFRNRPLLSDCKAVRIRRLPSALKTPQQVRETAIQQDVASLTPKMPHHQSTCIFEGLSAPNSRLLSLSLRLHFPLFSQEHFHKIPTFLPSCFAGLNYRGPWYPLKTLLSIIPHDDSTVPITKRLDINQLLRPKTTSSGTAKKDSSQ
jgi:hypothetical protein